MNAANESDEKELHLRTVQTLVGVSHGPLTKLCF